MEAKLRLAHTEIPTVTPITTRPQAMSVPMRVELASNIIAGVLHSMYEAQTHDNPTADLAHQPGAVQRVYEGMARLAVVPLLDPDRLKVAEQAAIKNAADHLLRYLDEDVEEGGHVSAERWEYRVTALVRSAIAMFQHELIAVAR